VTTAAPDLIRRLKLAGLLVVLGLIVEAITLFWSHPTAFLVFLFLGGMAYPLDKLPGALQAIAKLLPAAALTDTVRSVLSTQPFPTGQFVVLVAWAVGAPLAAARWFRWEE